MIDDAWVSPTLRETCRVGETHAHQKETAPNDMLGNQGSTQGSARRKVGYTMLSQAERNAFYPSLKECHGVAKDNDHSAFRWLRRYIDRTVGANFVSCKMLPNDRWWVMFNLDLTNKKTPDVIQEFAYVCYGEVQGVSLPLRFLPFATHPSNGGPETNLFWRIESYDARLTPDDVVAKLSSFVKKGLVRWPPQVGEDQ